MWECWWKREPILKEPGWINRSQIHGKWKPRRASPSETATDPCLENSLSSGGSECGSSASATTASLPPAWSLSGALEPSLIPGNAGRGDFLGAGIFSASVLYHFASHTVSTSQPLLQARENTKSKMKGKAPKIGILNHYWISISLH